MNEVGVDRAMWFLILEAYLLSPEVSTGSVLAVDEVHLQLNDRNYQLEKSQFYWIDMILSLMLIFGKRHEDNVFEGTQLTCTS